MVPWYFYENGGDDMNEQMLQKKFNAIVANISFADSRQTRFGGGSGNRGNRYVLKIQKIYPINR